MRSTPMNADGTNGRSEKVEIRVEPVADRVFLVAWQEANKTTVVQVEDFERKVILTNITRPEDRKSTRLNSSH